MLCRRVGYLEPLAACKHKLHTDSLIHPRSHLRIYFDPGFAGFALYLLPRASE